MLILGALALLAAVVPISASGAATGDGYMFEIGSGGQYAFDQDRQTDNDSSMDAIVKVYLDGDWAISGSLVDADIGTYTVAVGIAGECAPSNTPLFDIAVTDDPGVTVFGEIVTPLLPAGYDFIRIYKAGQACLTNWGSPIPSDNYGQITAPDTGEVLFIGDDLVLGADYFDNDYDPVQWAVREGTCDMVATQVRAGNVAGFSTPYDWDGMVFGSTIDTSTWVPGNYCFVFNPTNESGETDVRETRWFQLVDEPTLSCPDGQVFVSSVGIGTTTPVESFTSAGGYPYRLTVEGTYYAGGGSRYDIQSDAEFSRDEFQRVNALPWTDLVRG